MAAVEHKQHSKPKLTYFDGRGLAEVARLLLHDAGVDFEDVRITRETFDQLKASGSLPYGQVPILEHNNSKIAQSNSIYRYLAREYGYMGSNNVEAALIDSILEALASDLRPHLRSLWNEKDEAKKAELKDKLTKEVFPRWVGHFEDMLKHNHGGQGFIVGDKISLGDIALYYFFTSMAKDYPNVLEHAPLLRGLVDRVAQRPKIADYVAHRKETPF